MEKMRGHARIVSLSFNPLAFGMELMPVKQHRWKCREQAVGNLKLVAARPFRFEAAERRATGSQDIHGVRFGRELIENSFEVRWKAAQRSEFLAIRVQLASIGQAPV